MQKVTKRGVPKFVGAFFGGPKNKDYGIFGSILGSPTLGKLPRLQSKLIALFVIPLDLNNHSIFKNS